MAGTMVSWLFIAMARSTPLSQALGESSAFQVPVSGGSEGLS